MINFKSLFRSVKTKVFLLFLLIIISGLWLTSHYLLTWLNKEMDWEWYDIGGVQVTRTTDTHQLLFRKVYPFQQAVIFTSLTLDNRFDLFTIFKQSCTPQQSYTATVNDDKEQKQFPLICNENGHELSFRQVISSPPPLTITFNHRSVNFQPSHWALTFLKKDQFIQQNKHYFCTKKHFDACEYEWSRD
ncbi:hypothetical protein [Vibrio mangrovi]|uniref:Threonine transporter RhtB n=1 Tax=Vibrio mangrovi TaxID=474394 RepID=A0A1Y6IU77_9VIBR|nr:hypothetical protein [Vibrio mangrovi]MDW6002996.1 hypothetical protein [Vibrio mangrovi]SMS01237.1 hypothetical protein VIM7927_02519 [Vibrio mangrovi]